MDERLGGGSWRRNPEWSPLAELCAIETPGMVSPTFRWRFAGDRSPAGPEADLLSAPAPADALARAFGRLRSENSRAAATAAILWAQLDPRAAHATIDLLARVVAGEVPEGKDDAPLPPVADLQSAAVEAWCRVLVRAPEDPLETLGPAGRLLESDETPDHVRFELLTVLGRHIAPAAIPGLNAALAGTAATDDPVALRRAAMTACVLYAIHHRPAENTDDREERASAFAADRRIWPPVLLEWRNVPERGLSHPDPDVRHEFLMWLAAVRDPQALELARQQRRDADPRIRDDTLSVLAVLGTDEARGVLLDEARGTSGVQRARVIHALGGFDVDALAAHVDDPAWQVQEAVAEELGRYPTPAAAALLRNLATARPLQVQEAALRSVQRWPDELAIPVLLAAMQDGAVVQRAAAFDMLRRRKSLDTVFDHTERDPARRVAAIAAMAREFDLPAELAAGRGDTGAFGRPQPADDGSIELALLGLDDPDESVRRLAARRLADLASSRSLDAAAVARLRDRLLRDSDVEVWRYSVQAILPDGTSQSASIAALAAGHPAADIRVLACRYALRHRRPECAEWLRALFEDSSRRVQIAAIEAAGHCGNRAVLEDDVPLGTAPGTGISTSVRSFRGLRALLTDGNLRIRVAAAVAMCHLDDPAGTDELLRLSHTSDPTLRREIAAALAGVSHPQVVTRLAEMRQTKFDP